MLLHSKPLSAVISSQRRHLVTSLRRKPSHLRPGGVTPPENSPPAGHAAPGHLSQGGEPRDCWSTGGFRIAAAVQLKEMAGPKLLMRDGVGPYLVVGAPVSAEAEPVKGREGVLENGLTDACMVFEDMSMRMEKAPAGLGGER